MICLRIRLRPTLCWVPICLLKNFTSEVSPFYPASSVSPFESVPLAYQHAIIFLILKIKETCSWLYVYIQMFHISLLPFGTKLLKRFYTCTNFILVLRETKWILWNKGLTIEMMGEKLGNTATKRGIGGS